MYDDGSGEILTGCNECGKKFFFYIRKDQLERIKAKEEEGLELGAVEKEQIEKDVREISGFEDEETPVYLDFESVKVISPGKYKFDLTNLFSTTKPRVYRLEDGKYIIDLSSVKGGK